MLFIKFQILIFAIPFGINISDSLHFSSLFATHLGSITHSRFLADTRGSAATTGGATRLKNRANIRLHTRPALLISRIKCLVHPLFGISRRLFSLKFDFLASRTLIMNREIWYGFFGGAVPLDLLVLLLEDACFLFSLKDVGFLLILDRFGLTKLHGVSEEAEHFISMTMPLMFELFDLHVFTSIRDFLLLSLLCSLRLFRLQLEIEDIRFCRCWPAAVSSRLLSGSVALWGENWLDWRRRGHT